jgi:hypothetical protein
MTLLLLLLQAADVPAEEHRFVAPDPRWTLRERRLRMPLGPDDRARDRGDGRIELRRDGLIAVADDETPPVVWTERQWFDGPRLVRTFLYDGARRLRVEWEEIRGDSFTRLRGPDGRTSAYTRVRDLRFIEGFSEHEGARQVVVQGNGELVLPELRSGDWDRHWIRGGNAWLSREVRQGRCTRVHLRAGGAWFHIDSQGENLTLDDEIWLRPVGGRPYYQLSKYFLTTDGQLREKAVTAKPDVRELPLVELRRGHEPEDMHEPIYREWAVAYPKRRAAFLARVETILRDAGHTWESLGIAFIRDAAAGPR